jgi:hypothetical protein
MNTEWITGKGIPSEIAEKNEFSSVALQIEKCISFVQIDREYQQNSSER